MANRRQFSRPANRRLRVFAFDPSLRESLELRVLNSATLEIPWESHPTSPSKDGPAPGPVGEYVEVVDYDPVVGCFYEPVNLNDPYLISQDGLAPSDGDPQFHQQMVYAVAMKTIKRFEDALGRPVLWSPMNNGEAKYVPRLRIYPHAFREANAYYSPSKKALLFGYFPATASPSGHHFPGGIVFTCLSNDIVVHEVTHALLDGFHPRFNEPSNPDVLAFHEAFADIVAIFEHFSLPNVVEHQIAKTRGKLATDGLLSQLAKQFGHAIGRSAALRSAIGEPDPGRMTTTFEPHQRGSILVAAVFHAFLEIYRNRTADLLRIATGGTGVLEEGAALHPDLVRRLSKEASKTADHILQMCIRALDYLPPVDVTFGDYLRALITSDHDLVPADRYGYRTAMIEGFRRYGIYPARVRSMSENSLLWENPAFEQRQTLGIVQQLSETVKGWDLMTARKDLYDAMEEARAGVHGIIEKTRAYKMERFKGIDIANENHRFEVHAIRPVRRIGPRKQILTDVVIEMTQRRPGYVDAAWGDITSEDNIPEHDFLFRGGCTIIADLRSSEIRYCIYKDINGEARYRRQQAFLGGETSGLALRSTYFDDRSDTAQNNIFAHLHRAAERSGESETGV